MAVALKGLSLEAFLKLPERKPALEYFNGMVTQKMPPMSEHSALQGDLTEHLNRLFRGNRIARAFPELRATFDGVSVVLDVSLYRWERIPRTPAGRMESHFMVSPDVAIEVWSVGQSMRELTERCAWYVEHGALIALLVHHRQETIRVFLPNESLMIHRAGDRIALEAIAPGAELEVSAIMAALNVD